MADSNNNWKVRTEAIDEMYQLLTEQLEKDP